MESYTLMLCWVSFPPPTFIALLLEAGGWREVTETTTSPPFSFSAIQSRYTCIMTENNNLFWNPPLLRAVIGLSKCSRCQDPSKILAERTGEAKVSQAKYVECLCIWKYVPKTYCQIADCLSLKPT